MSQNRRPQDFRRLEDAQVTQVRRGEAERSLVVTGYSPGGSAQHALPTPGDQKFPFVKDVPDVMGPLELRNGEVDDTATVVNALPLVTDPYLVPPDPGAYERSPIIDTRGIRVVTLVLDYFPGDNGQFAGLGELSLILQERVQPINPTGTETAESQFRTTGVVDPTLNVPGLVQSYAMQRVYPRELRLAPNFVPGGAAVPVALGIPVPITLDFDVGRYDEIRFLWGDTVSAVASLRARAFLMR